MASSDFPAGDNLSLAPDKSVSHVHALARKTRTLDTDNDSAPEFSFLSSLLLRAHVCGIAQLQESNAQVQTTDGGMRAFLVWSPPVFCAPRVAAIMMICCRVVLLGVETETCKLRKKPVE